MVLEGLKTEDKPTAVGYFVLDTLRSLFQSGILATDEIRVTVALVTPDELEELKKHVHVFVPPQEVDQLGPLYKLILDVSRGTEEADEQS
jgi:hypothetical protein